MQFRRLAPLGLALTASATVLASIAHGSSPPAAPQDKRLDQACGAAAHSIDKVLVHAWAAEPETIESKLDVVTPGKLTGRIAFNRAGRRIMVAGDPSSTSGSSFGCAQGRAGRHGLGPGRSRVVSTLTETFTRAGTYTLSFRLNEVGRTLVRQLAAAERTYDKQHPSGDQPPSLAFGVSLTYESGS